MCQLGTTLLSCAQGLLHGTFRCPETCLEGSKLKSCKISPKPTWIELELDEHRPLKYTYGTKQF